MTTESVSATPPDADDGLRVWRRAVAGVLAKARKVDAAALGDTPERLLDNTSYDGLTLAALYTPADELPEPPLPGTHPFTRGRTTDRDTTVGWGVRTRHGLGLGPDADADAVNTAVLNDLENGATSLWFALGAGNLPHTALGGSLEGVFLDLAPVVLDAGDEMTAAAEAFLALLEHTDADLSEVHAHLGADPLTVLVRGGADLLDEAVALAVRAHEHTAPLTSITVDGTVFHDAGAGDAQERGAALAAGGSYYVEQLTAGLAGAAWAFFTELEGAGGFRAALDSGLLAERIATTAQARATDIARRAALLTGVSEFPNLAEAPPMSTAEPSVSGALPVTRRAQPFEALRDRSDAHLAATGARPLVRLVTLGPLAEHTLRAGWTTNLLAAGGIEAVKDSQHSPVAVLVGTDERYRRDGADALVAARADGATTVLLAGPAKAWPTDAPQRPDGNLSAGADAVVSLTHLLDTLTADPSEVPS